MIGVTPIPATNFEMHTATKLEEQSSPWEKTDIIGISTRGYLYNGNTAALQATDRGSIPRSSTNSHLPMVGRGNGAVSDGVPSKTRSAESSVSEQVLQWLLRSTTIWSIAHVVNWHSENEQSAFSANTGRRVSKISRNSNA